MGLVICVFYYGNNNIEYLMGPVWRNWDSQLGFRLVTMNRFISSQDINGCKHDGCQSIALVKRTKVAFSSSAKDAMSRNFKHKISHNSYHPALYSSVQPVVWPLDSRRPYPDLGQVQRELGQELLALGLKVLELLGLKERRQVEGQLRLLY